MRDTERVALYEAIKDQINEIDSLFEEYGLSPEDFDPDSEEFDSVRDTEVGKVYGLIHNLKVAVE